MNIETLKQRIMSEAPAAITLSFQEQALLSAYLRTHRLTITLSRLQRDPEYKAHVRQQEQERQHMRFILLYNQQVAHHSGDAPSEASRKLIARSSTLRRPSKRAERAAAIEKLVRALKEHVEAQRDGAQDARRRGVATPPAGGMTQRFLSTLAGVPETTVSRCLRDPNAKVLQLFWEKVAGKPARGQSKSVVASDSIEEPNRDDD